MSAMSDGRLAQCEDTARQWSARADADPIAARVDALAAAGFVDELCKEVRRLRSDLDDAAEALSNIADLARPVVVKYTRL